MRHTSLIFPAAVNLLALLVTPGQAIAQEQQNAGHPMHYAVTDLGTLGGTSSVGLGINAQAGWPGPQT